MLIVIAKYKVINNQVPSTYHVKIHSSLQLVSKCLNFVDQHKLYLSVGSLEVGMHFVNLKSSFCNQSVKLEVVL